MAVEAELSGRKKKILKAVVELYVKTAEPVGSKAIASALDNRVSSATIRNEMAELEEQGYLEKLLHFESRNAVTNAQFAELRAEMERYLKGR